MTPDRLEVDLSADEWWPVPRGVARVTLTPDDPAFVIVAHLGGDAPPPITTPDLFVVPAVLPIGGLADGRRVWLRASRGAGRVLVELTPKTQD